MEITWLGHASFKIRTYVSQYGWVTVVTDPYDSEMVGLRFPKTTADIVTVSHDHQDHSASEAIGKDPSVPDGPKILRGSGEYEVKGVTIRGVPTWHDEKKGELRGENTVFVIESEGIRVAHLGDLGHTLTDDQLGEIGNIDIVLIPVGGFYTIDAEVAVEVVGQLEPKVTIPMHYKVPGMKEGFDKLAGVEEFVKEMGAEAKLMPKFEVKKGGFGEEMELVILERKP